MLRLCAVVNVETTWRQTACKYSHVSKDVVDMLLCPFVSDTAAVWSKVKIRFHSRLLWKTYWTETAAGRPPRLQPLRLSCLINPFLSYHTYPFLKLLSKRTNNHKEPPGSKLNMKMKWLRSSFPSIVHCFFMGNKNAISKAQLQSVNKWEMVDSLYSFYSFLNSCYTRSQGYTAYLCVIQSLTYRKWNSKKK